MAYNIKLRVFPGNPGVGLFSIVEKTCWGYAGGGTWSEADGVHTLAMGGSGTSGVIRFKSDLNEIVTIAVGVHNNVRWCDIVTGLAFAITALVINGEYYNDGPRALDRTAQRAAQNILSATGTNVNVNYTVADGNNLMADVIFG